MIDKLEHDLAVLTAAREADRLAILRANDERDKARAERDEARALLLDIDQWFRQDGASFPDYIQGRLDALKGEVRGE